VLINNTNEGAQFDISEDALMKPKKVLKEYQNVFNTNTEFFSTYNPDMIEDALRKYLETTL